ncbi:hypothetical protein QYF36_020547 [Acer negundo]|nr:hypothetical protein QYF36_020547 [Acer negundo]
MNKRSRNQDLHYQTDSRPSYNWGKLTHREGVLREFTMKHKPHSSLDLPRCDRWLLVVSRKPRGLLSKLLENVVDKTVHDPHSLARDSEEKSWLL